MPSLPRDRRMIACGIEGCELGPVHEPHYRPKPRFALFIADFAELLGITPGTFTRMRSDKRLSEDARPPLPDDYELMVGGARPWWSRSRARAFKARRGRPGGGGGAGKHRKTAERKP